MSRRVFQTTLVLLAAGVILAGEYRVADENRVLILKSEGAGPVRFTHLAHSRMDGMTCVKCHGSIAEQGVFRPCQVCHADRGVILTDEEAFHGFCVECHEQSTNTAAPTGCAGCHY
jgi:hypothetical protein